VLVADIMKSLTVYKFEEGQKGRLQAVVVCRDPRGQWCLDMLQVDPSQYLISDFKSNLVLLQKQGKLFRVSIAKSQVW